MRPTNLAICSAILASVVTVRAPRAPAAENHDDKPFAFKWDRIIGTWVDAGTNGAKIKTTYAWKLRSKVIEAHTKSGKKEKVALIAVSGNTDALQFMADNRGTTALGQWTLRDGDAILDVEVDAGVGPEFKLRTRYHFEDDDTLVWSIEDVPLPLKFKLVRQESEN